MNGQENLYLERLICPLCDIFVLYNHTTMKLFVKFFIYGIIFSVFASVHAQNALLSTIRFLPDTSIFMSTDSAKTTVKYLGTTPYSGPLFIYYTTDTLNFTPVIQLDSVQVNFMNQNDTIQIVSPILFDISNGFLGGNGIVVVWSSGNGIVPVDSLRSPIYLKIQSSINETISISSFSIYPTISKDLITIEYLKNILPMKIFIKDVSGKIINVTTPSIENKNRIKIKTSELNSGIYFLDILLPDKQRVVSKFIKAD